MIIVWYGERPATVVGEEGSSDWEESESLETELERERTGCLPLVVGVLSFCAEVEELAVAVAVVGESFLGCFLW